MTKKQVGIALILSIVFTGGVFAVDAYQSKANKKTPLLDPLPALKDPAAIGRLGLVEQTNHLVAPEEESNVAKLEGQEAPDFRLLDATGEVFQLSQAVLKKPVLLFFVEKECPCCVGAKPFVERLRDAHQADLQVVGIINTDLAGAKKWEREVSALFPVVIDTKQEVIQAYHATRGAYTMLVAQKDGQPTIIRAFAGYSKSMMQDLSASVSALSKSKPPTLNVDGAPDVLVSGCNFPTAKP